MHLSLPRIRECRLLARRVRSLGTCWCCKMNGVATLGASPAVPVLPAGGYDGTGYADKIAVSTSPAVTKPFAGKQHDHLWLHMAGHLYSNHSVCVPQSQLQLLVIATHGGPGCSTAIQQSTPSSTVVSCYDAITTSLCCLVLQNAHQKFRSWPPPCWASTQPEGMISSARYRLQPAAWPVVCRYMQLWHSWPVWLACCT